MPLSHAIAHAAAGQLTIKAALLVCLPESGCSIDLVHGSTDPLVRLDVSYKCLDDHEAEVGHALCELVLHLMSNLLLGLQCTCRIYM